MNTDLSIEITMLTDRLMSGLQEELKFRVENELRGLAEDNEQLYAILSLLQDLNPEQLDAVLHNHDSHGPLLIFACAGSGKTTALTHRVIYLLLKGVKPKEMLAVTFTVKAAQEMNLRIKKFFMKLLEKKVYLDRLLEIEKELPSMWVGTFHSICLRILKEEIDGRFNIERVGYKPGFQVTENNWVYVKKAMEETGLGEENVYEYMQKIDAVKNELMDYEKFSVRARSEEKIYLPVFKKYQQKLKERQVLDFNDLLMQTVNLFQNHKEILRAYQERFKFILIDEYQDTNYAQYTFSRLIIGQRNGLFVVGDDDQSIYGWRGADIRNILFFEKDYPGTRKIRLTKNYRSTGTIIKAANNIFVKVKKKDELLKVIETTKTNSDGSILLGDKIFVYRAESDKDEMRFCIFQLKRLMKERNYKYGDFTFLYRINEQNKNIKSMLSEQGIPFTVYDPKFFSRKEINDVLAYLKVIALVSRMRLANDLDEDDLTSFDKDVTRLFRLPPCKFFDKTILIPLDHVFCKVKVFTEPAVFTTTVNRIQIADAKLKLKQLYDLVNLLSASKGSISALLSELIDMTEYLGRDRFARLKTEVERNIEILIDESKKFEEMNYYSENGSYVNPLYQRIGDFVDSIAMRTRDTEQSPASKTENVANLMTVHSAKGLEFQVVFLLGAEEGLFPHVHFSVSKLPKKEQLKRIDEERRLFYVAITRAKESLFITYADKRTMYDKERGYKPSRFFETLPADTVVRGDYFRNGFERFKDRVKRFVF